MHLIAAGLLLIFLYALHIAPPGLGPLGYVYDSCSYEIMRRLLAENLDGFFPTSFRTEAYFAPGGVSFALNSFSFERDWPAALAWRWNRDFPIFWVLYGLSLGATFLGSGWLLRRMGLSSRAAWALALAGTLFNVPRNAKAWHHYDFLLQHWLYWSLLLDAWIWRRVVRENRWSLHLEAWRGTLLVGTAWMSGYFWGPLTALWAIVRAAILLRRLRPRAVGPALRIDLAPAPAAAATVVAAAMIAVSLPFLLPWARAFLEAGRVPQATGHTAPPAYWVMPLWLERLGDLVRLAWPDFRHFAPIRGPETVVSVGWVYLVPALLGVRAARRATAGPGLAIVAPFLALLALLVLYGLPGLGFFREIVRRVHPLMEHFRTASRTGLFLPPLLLSMIALLWPQITDAAARLWRERPRLTWALIGLSALELSWVVLPPNAQPSLPVEVGALLEDVRARPGDTVLDLPFCVHGANGPCGGAGCTGYPLGTYPLCLANRHGKRVYGACHGRMMPAQCAVYAAEPYADWGRAWSENRCLQTAEWEALCARLGVQPHAAVMVHPTLWPAVNRAECRRELEARLGPPLREATLMAWPSRDGQGRHPVMLRQYAGTCRPRR